MPRSVQTVPRVDSRRPAAPCDAFRAFECAPFRDPLFILRFINRHFIFCALSSKWHRATLAAPSRDDRFTVLTTKIPQSDIFYLTHVICTERTDPTIRFYIYSPYTQSTMYFLSAQPTRRARGFRDRAMRGPDSMERQPRTDLEKKEDIFALTLHCLLVERLKD